MSITNLSSTSASGSQEILSRSLNRLAAQTQALDLTDELTVSGNFDTQRQQAQTDLADVQTAVTAAQTTDGALGQVDDLLSQMNDLVQNGGNSAASQTQFKALQDQLATAIGTAASAGGTPSSDALQSLVAKNADGDYTLTLSSGDTSDTIKSATQDVAAGRSGLAAGLSQLQHRAAALQVEFANLNSAVPSLQSEDDASSATQLAKYTLSTQSDAALAAQSAGSTAAAFKLLES